MTTMIGQQQLNARHRQPALFLDLPELLVQGHRVTFDRHSNHFRFCSEKKTGQLWAVSGRQWCCQVDGDTTVRRGNDLLQLLEDAFLVL